MEATDETLAQAAAKGDRKAFSLLLARNYDRLFGLCFRLADARAADGGGDWELNRIATDKETRAGWIG